MQATIYKYAYWQFILAILPLFFLCMMLPHKLFPETTKANPGTTILISLAVLLVILFFMIKRAFAPRATLTLQIDKGEFKLTQGDKTVISEFESNVQMVLAKYKASTTNHTPYLLLKFLNQNNKQILKIKVEGSVKLNKGFPDTLGEYDISDMWGYYETNSTEALKILKFYGCERLVTFK